MKFGLILGESPAQERVRQKANREIGLAHPPTAADPLRHPGDPGESHLVLSLWGVRGSNFEE
jgi:hypothetical protein